MGVTNIGDTPGGDIDDPTATCQSASDDGPCMVGSNPRDVTRDGISDMAGNLSEWTDSGTGVRMYTMGGHYASQLGPFFEFDSSLGRRMPFLGFRCAATINAPNPYEAIRGTRDEPAPATGVGRGGGGLHKNDSRVTVG